MIVSLVCRLDQILGNPKNHWKKFQPITHLFLSLKDKVKPYDESCGQGIHNVYYEYDDRNVSYILLRISHILVKEIHLPRSSFACKANHFNIEQKNK